MLSAPWKACDGKVVWIIVSAIAAKGPGICHCPAILVPEVEAHIKIPPETKSVP